MLEPAFLVAVTCVVVASWAGVRCLELEGLERPLAGFVLGATQVLVATTVAGGLGVLRAWPIVILHLVFAALAVGTWWSVGRPRPAHRSERSHRPAELVGRAMRAPATLVLLAVALLESAYLVVAAWLLPPYTWDPIWYHLTTVAWWLQREGFDTNPFVYLSNAYPANGELAFAWLVVLHGSDTWVQLVQLAFAVGGAVATAAIAQAVGVSRSSAIAAGCLFLATPIVFAQASTEWVDVVLGASLLAATCFLLRFCQELWRTDGRPLLAHLVLSGLAGGVVVGTKAIGILFIGAGAALLVAHLAVAAARRGLPVLVVVRCLAAFSLPCLALGGFWYGQNLVREGNPLHPFRLEVAGTVLFEGDVDPALITSDDISYRPDAGPIELIGESWTTEPTETRADERLGGFGLQWPFAALPALAAVAIALAVRRRPVELGFLVVAAVLVVVHPFGWWSRFNMHLSGIGAVAIVVVVQHLRWRWLAGMAQLGVIGLAVASLVPAIPRQNLSGDPFDLEVLADLADRPAGDRTLGRLVLPAELGWADHVPPGSSLGVRPEDVFFQFWYAAFGPDLVNRVLPLAGRGGPIDRVGFLRAVESDRLTHVLVVEGTEPKQWVQGDPARFALHEDLGRYEVFRVVRPGRLGVGDDER